jgi:hypothetical protein
MTTIDDDWVVDGRLKWGSVESASVFGAAILGAGGGLHFASSGWRWRSLRGWRRRAPLVCRWISVLAGDGRSVRIVGVLLLLLARWVLDLRLVLSSRAGI